MSIQCFLTLNGLRLSDCESDNDFGVWPLSSFFRKIRRPAQKNEYSRLDIYTQMHSQAQQQEKYAAGILYEWSWQEF